VIIISIDFPALFFKNLISFKINTQDSLPSLFNITNDEIETVIRSESNEHISKKYLKRASVDYIIKYYYNCH
jgi:hypothetical protein